MSNAIKMFALEIDQLGGPAYVLSEKDLGGHQYDGVMLFRDRKEAQVELDDELANGADEDELGIATVYLHGNGAIFDDGGFEVNKHIALQTGQTEAQVKAHIAAYHKSESSQPKPSVGI
jgi:hypothetical protein